MTDDEARGAAARIHQQQTWVDQQVRQAMARGDFDDLPGAGKPIPDLGTRHDPDWWVKQLIERERITGVLPAALQLRKDDAELDGRLDRLMSEREVREELDDFNQRVVTARRQLQGGPPVITPTRDVEATVSGGGSGAWAPHWTGWRRPAEQQPRTSLAVPSLTAGDARPRWTVSLSPWHAKRTRGATGARPTTPSLPTATSSTPPIWPGSRTPPGGWVTPGVDGALGGDLPASRRRGGRGRSSRPRVAPGVAVVHPGRPADRARLGGAGTSPPGVTAPLLAARLPRLRERRRRHGRHRRPETAAAAAADGGAVRPRLRRPGAPRASPWR